MVCNIGSKGPKHSKVHYLALVINLRFSCYGEFCNKNRKMSVCSLSQVQNITSKGPKHSTFHSLPQVINFHSRGYEELSEQFL